MDMQANRMQIYAVSMDKQDGVNHFLELSLWQFQCQSMCACVGIMLWKQLGTCSKSRVQDSVIPCVPSFRCKLYSDITTLNRVLYTSAR